MPKDTSIKKVLVIGSGPIVIGQAAEFDYAGTQACRVLKEEGLEVVLVNSNPATIMTDKRHGGRSLSGTSDHAKPSSASSWRRSPTALLAGLGGQTGLTIAMELAHEGFLERAQRAAASAPTPTPSTKPRTGSSLRTPWRRIGQPVIPSDIVA